MRGFEALLIIFLVGAPPATAMEYTEYRYHGNCVTYSVFDPMVDDLGAYFGCGSDPTIFAGGWVTE